MTDCQIRPSEMKNRQIRLAEVDGIINKKYYRTSPPGGVFRIPPPYPLLSGSIYKGMVYMFMVNMISVVNN